MTPDEIETRRREHAQRLGQGEVAQIPAYPDLLIVEEATQLWKVSVNNGQKQYLIHADDVGMACMVAGQRWRADPDISAKQRAKGIYDVRGQAAKMSDAEF
jgi:hypothetical protein